MTTVHHLPLDFSWILWRLSDCAISSKLSMSVQLQMAPLMQDQLTKLASNCWDISLRSSTMGSCKRTPLTALKAPSTQSNSSRFLYFTCTQNLTKPVQFLPKLQLLREFRLESTRQRWVLSPTNNSLETTQTILWTFWWVIWTSSAHKQLNRSDVPSLNGEQNRTLFWQWPE